MAKKGTNTNKPKRTINAGLKAWNEARYLFARENRRLGKKYSGKEINAFTKAFRLENPISFNESDFNFFVKTEIPVFYNNPLDLGSNNLDSQIYFSIDSAILKLPKGINVVVNSGYIGGKIEFNTTDYIYSDSGLHDVVEDIRAEIEGSEDRYPPFEGFIKRIDGASEDSIDAKDYYIEWILFIGGEFVSEIKGSIEPKGAKTDLGFGEVKVSKRKKPKKSKVKKRVDKTVPLEKYRELKKKQDESEKKQAQLQKQIEELQKQMAELMKKNK